MKTQLAWRFRKGSMADPFNFKECGCKFYVYDKVVVRYCQTHLFEYKQALAKFEGKE